MKRMFISVTIEENKKYYAYVIPVSSNDNLLSKLSNENILHANIYNTKKRAEEVVKMWNESYVKNGTYLFDEIKF